jgi:hypothetical protein
MLRDTVSCNWRMNLWTEYFKDSTPNYRCIHYIPVLFHMSNIQGEFDVQGIRKFNFTPSFKWLSSCTYVRILIIFVHLAVVGVIIRISNPQLVYHQILCFGCNLHNWSFIFSICVPELVSTPLVTIISLWGQKTKHLTNLSLLFPSSFSAALHPSLPWKAHFWLYVPLNQIPFQNPCTLSTQCDV